MGLRISTNMASLSAQRALSKNSQEIGKSLEKLSSGNRINSASDDAAGLSISENLRAQIRSSKQAERNAQDAISLVQVAEGGFNEIGNILIRMRELSIQASSDTIGDRERSFIDKEYQSIKAEVDRIANTTQFNGTPLLNGEAAKELEFQVGNQNTPNDRIVFNTRDYAVSTSYLGIDGANTNSKSNARDALEKIDDAISKVSGARSGLGALQNKLQSATNTIQIQAENLANMRSRISDVDLAEESANLAQKNILQSAGISVLAQANAAPQQALKLL